MTIHPMWQTEIIYCSKFGISESIRFTKRPFGENDAGFFISFQLVRQLTHVGQLLQVA